MLFGDCEADYEMIDRVAECDEAYGYEELYMTKEMVEKLISSKKDIVVYIQMGEYVLRIIYDDESKQGLSHADQDTIEQESCEDFISRQAVLDCLKATKLKQSKKLDLIIEMRKKVMMLPPVTPYYTNVEIQKMQEMEQAEIQKAYECGKHANRWISVSERLPEIHQDVLLSLRSLDVVIGFRATTEPYFYCKGIGSCYIDPQNVLAWQPLPESYKAESEG